MRKHTQNLGTYSQVAELTCSCIRTVRRRIEDGTYISYKIHGKVLIDLDSVQRAMGTPANARVLTAQNRRALEVTA